MIPLRRPPEDCLTPATRTRLAELRAETADSSLPVGERTALWQRLSSGPTDEYVELRDALIAMSSGRCAWCERRPRAWEVDHVLPKSRYPERMFEWTNLLPSCKECNHGKGSHNTLVDGTSEMIDPSCEDPAVLIWWDAYGWPSPRKRLSAEQAHRAKKTLAWLKLTDIELCARREEVLLNVIDGLRQVEAALAAPRDEDRCRRACRTLVNRLAPKGPYRAIVRQWVTHPKTMPRLRRLCAQVVGLEPALDFYADLGAR